MNRRIALKNVDRVHSSAYLQQITTDVNNLKSFYNGIELSERFAPYLLPAP